jgi:hypothetical protein
MNEQNKKRIKTRANESLSERRNPSELAVFTLQFNQINLNFCDSFSLLLSLSPSQTIINKLLNEYINQNVALN